ncbi:MFS transporter [Microlunatus soli]|uniref:MFS transporter, SHS family, lactate transporter n=1 Tax=Microlunatus soli TaxID=630515 RepID=A0A1H2AFT5_9ACTN|nr:MFS transporter [Microlunatus soli]SDT44803.1 MFS transporter, SHS family, lactate transporter [Microlunatus soli]
MSQPTASAKLDSDQRSAFAASWLGWMLDAFDYFLIVLVYAEIGKDFGVSLERMAFLTTITLIMRPVGAYLFGIWADRVGRRLPLIVDVCFYSVVGFACAFAPNFTVLFILRLLYGIGMGGEWGLGAALTMEKVPRHRRGFFSGILQGGYSCGYLLASLAFLLVHSALGLSWRWLFALSILPALISLIIRTRVRESEVWETTRTKMNRSNTSIRQVFLNPKVLRRFIYLVLLMAAFNWMSHGTQDIYPTFLKSTEHGGAGLAATTASWIAVIYNIGAAVGCVIFGSLSDRWGRGRKGTIILGAALTLPIIPIFAFSQTAGWLCLGSALIQATTQGAWGAIPAHLNELSPNAIRGFYPGVTYQLGNLIAAFNLPIQQALSGHVGYPTAMAVTVGGAAIAVIVLTAFGRQAKAIDFSSDEPAELRSTG